MAENLFQIARINNKSTRNTNRFTLEFLGLESLLIAPLNSDYIGYDAYKIRAQAVAPALSWGTAESYNVNEALQLSLLSATIPNIQVETQRIQRFNDSVVATTKFAEPEDMTVTFYDYFNGSSSAIMQLWQSLVGDKRTGAMGFKESFVLPRAVLTEFGPDAPAFDPDNSQENDGEIPWLSKHEVINIFPKAVNLGEFTYDGADARKVEVTFSTDNVYPIGYRSFEGVEAGTSEVNVFGSVEQADSNDTFDPNVIIQALKGAV